MPLRRKDGRGRHEGFRDLREAFIDGSFAPAKKGGACVGKTKRGKGSKTMAIADCHGRPVAIHIDSATPHEVTLVKATLAQMLVKGPKRLISDNAYESDQRCLHSPPVLYSTAIGALVPKSWIFLSACRIAPR
jgi:hypothetical protein